MTEPKFARLQIDEIVPGPNVRVDLRDIEELAADIRERGILQPLTVVPAADGKSVELLIGHRRYAAAKLAGLQTVPCITRSRVSETGRILDQISENLQRCDMTVLEEAKAYRSLLDAGLSYEAIGARVHRSDYWVKQIVGLLALPECVQKAAHDGVLNKTQAIGIPREMLNVPGAEKRLATSLEKQGKSGLAFWYRGEYARREAKEYAADGRKAAPSATISDKEAIRLGREQEARRRAYSTAAKELIERYRQEFDALYGKAYRRHLEILA